MLYVSFDDLDPSLLSYQETTENHPNLNYTQKNVEKNRKIVNRKEADPEFLYHKMDHSCHQGTNFSNQNVLWQLIAR